MLVPHRVQVNKYGEPWVLRASGVVEGRDPHKAQRGGGQHGGVLRQVPVPVDHVLLEQPNGQHQRGVRGDSVDTRLEVGQFDYVVLQGDVGVAGEIGEALDPDHIDNKVEGGKVFQRVPDLRKEVRSCVARDIGGIEFFEPEDGHGQDEDHAEQQPVVGVDR